MSGKTRSRAARRDAMRSHPAGKGRVDDLDFGPLMAGMDTSREGLDRRAWDALLRFDMSAIGRKPVVGPNDREGAR